MTMTPLRLLPLASFALCALASPALAQLYFYDDFNRETLGSNWTTTGGDFHIDAQNRLRQSAAGTGTEVASEFAFFNGFELTNSWTMVVHAEFVAQTWHGFAMNIQETNGVYTTYTSRFRNHTAPAGHQWFDTNGTGSSFSWVASNTSAPSTTLAANTLYRFEYGWDVETPNVIRVAIYDNGVNLLDASLSISGGNWRNHTGAGFAGIYDARALAVHDFELTVIPEAGTTGAVAGVSALLAAFWIRRRRRS
jgi:hypothetical protein